MKNLIPIIILILFSCTKDVEKNRVEEILSAKPVISLQERINNSKNGTVRVNGDYTEDIVIPEGVTVILKGTLYGHIELHGGAFIGNVATASGYGEAISVKEGVNVIQGNINSYSSAIVTYSGKTTYTGNVNAQIDYGIRNAGGELSASGNVYSKYNSALHNSGGDSYTEFTGTLKSDYLYGFEMSGGSGKLKDVLIITTTLDPIEGSGISKYGGDKLQMDNVTINCTGTYSIEKQGVTDKGVIEFISPCYVNKPIEPGMNIINPNYLIIK